MLCACVVPCVRVQCARALRVHTRGYTHLISANGFRFDARGSAEMRAAGTHQVLSSLPRVVGGYRVSNTGGSRDIHRTLPGSRYRYERRPLSLWSCVLPGWQFNVNVNEKAVERGGVHTADGSLQALHVKQ